MVLNFEKKNGSTENEEQKERRLVCVLPYEVAKNGKAF